MEQVKCFIPETLEEALRIRKETGATVLAGGSDLMVANSMGAGVTPAFKGDVLIITNLKELKGIRALPDLPLIPILPCRRRIKLRSRWSS